MRTFILTASLAVLALSGCAGLSDRESRILGGAAIGGVVGNVVTDGSPLGTLGGAAIGGVIGSEVDRNSWEYRYNQCRRYETRRYCERTVR